MSKIDDITGCIPAVNKSIEPEIQAHLDDLTKPPGSLGRLEEIAMKYCLIVGTSQASQA